MSWATVGRWLPRSVRAMLLLLPLLVLLPVLLVQAWIYQGRFEARRLEEYQTNLEVARAVSLAFDVFLRDVLNQQAGLGLTLTSEGWDHGGAGLLLRATSLLDPTVVDYTWVGLDGHVIASSEPTVPDQPSTARAEVREVLEGQPWQVGDLTHDPFTERSVFGVAREVRDLRGVRRGVLAARIDADRLGSVLALPRADDGSVAIVDRQGRSVYRYPQVALPWESRALLPTKPIMAEALAGREVVGPVASPIDGEVRMAALVPIASTGWVASASRPQAEALGPIAQAMVGDFVLLLLAALASTLGVLLLSRAVTAPLAHLRQHALAVGQGDLSRRVEIARPSELGEVARAFNRMAEELARREEERSELEQQKDAVVAMVSHDLQTPLAVVKGHAQLLRRSLRSGQAPNPERLLAGMAAIDRTVDRMVALLSELRDADRLRAGRPLELERHPVDLVALALRLVRDQSSASSGRSIRVEVAAPAITGRWDAARLERVVSNLLSNAIKYSPSGGEVVVSLEQGAPDGKSWAILRVRDRGLGIPAADLPTIFEPYRRGRNVVGRIAGTGLGLAGAREIVQAHGGTLEVESREGLGTTVTMRLPLDEIDQPKGLSEGGPQPGR